ncbi:hypothetical protein SAMN05421805_103391 [Saccharopolyspora antimicrobica]|uniref:Uncharacterized protein n=1 Tax=Saccharopolyspora antimicrobica TaxID=455193 RepID=A0A1I4XE33_9PSEU|nr:hypothetical protein [Saccharopolyspora antimicrobica]RKT84460.1 hypothetical protein ATL45_2775 [Saccharopolyspora antimicrobica]SFN23932.1 hypothetical protein SAMN05421805_103391 [Saccharopolyspora antimicrobica]
MFEEFVVAYRCTSAGSAPEVPDSVHPVLKPLFSRFGGSTFDDGLYRVHTPESAQVIDGYVVDAFPELAERVACFGFDWLGQQWAVDAGTGAADDPHVLLLNPSTGEVSPFPVPYSRFHDSVLVDIKDLGEEQFGLWTADNPGHVPLAFDECVANTIPLFAGGEDSWANLSKQNLQVVWGTHSQILAQLR